MSITVICPTRGRPEQARQVQESFTATASLLDTRLVFVADIDDQTVPDYDKRCHIMLNTDLRGMGAALNEATRAVIEGWDPTYIGMIGDDNRFRSVGWDIELSKALDEMGGGVAYADDLWHHDALPTAWFVSSSIIRALGWNALPTLTHLYMDNVWMTIGRGVGHYMYVPSAVIEHLHPTYNKAEWDDSYRKTNSPEMYAKDGAAFMTWLATDAQADIEKAKAAL